MKKHLFARSHIFFVLGIAFVATLHSENIIINGTMNNAILSYRKWSDKVDTIPYGWQNPMKARDAGVEVTWVSDSAQCHSPGGAMKVVAKPESNTILSCELLREPEPGDRITGRLYAKYEKLKPYTIQIAVQPGVYPGIEDSTKWESLGWWRFFMNSKKSLENYKEFEMEEAVMPERFTTFGIYFVVRNEGSEDAVIWVDDIELCINGCSATGTTVQTAKKNAFNPFRIAKSRIIVFPNTAKYLVELYTLNGRLYKSIAGFGKTVHLNKMGIVPGAYFLKISSDQGNYAGKMILRGDQQDRCQQTANTDQ